MIRRTLLTLALLATPAIVVAQQQPSPMQGQAPAADTGKAKAKPAKKGKMKTKKGGKAAKPAAKDTTTKKP